MADDRGAQVKALISRLLPHELVFALLVSVLLLLSLFRAGIASAPSLLSAALLVVLGVVTWFTSRRQTIGFWRMRLLFHLVYMNAVYFALGTIIPAIRGRRYDAVLQSVDTSLFGDPLPMRVDGFTQPLLSDFLSFCYMLLFPYIVFSCVRQAWKARDDLATAQRFFSGFFTVYGVGFFGYLLLPAQGPYLDIPNLFQHPIEGGWLTELNARIVRDGSNRVDVFPSLHVAGSCFMLFFDRRHARWRYYGYLIPAVGLWISTIYLRFHYGIDVLAGFATAALGMSVARRLSAVPDAHAITRTGT